MCGRCFWPYNMSSEEERHAWRSGDSIPPCCAGNYHLGRLLPWCTMLGAAVHDAAAFLWVLPCRALRLLSGEAAGHYETESCLQAKGADFHTRRGGARGIKCHTS